MKYTKLIHWQCWVSGFPFTWDHFFLFLSYDSNCLHDPPPPPPIRFPRQPCSGIWGNLHPSKKEIAPICFLTWYLIRRTHRLHTNNQHTHASTHTHTHTQARHAPAVTMQICFPQCLRNGRVWVEWAYSVQRAWLFQMQPLPSLLPPPPQWLRCQIILPSLHARRHTNYSEITNHSSPFGSGSPRGSGRRDARRFRVLKAVPLAVLWLDLFYLLLLFCFYSFWTFFVQLCHRSSTVWRRGHREPGPANLGPLPWFYDETFLRGG